MAPNSALNRLVPSGRRNTAGVLAGGGAESSTDRASTAATSRRCRVSRSALLASRYFMVARAASAWMFQCDQVALDSWRRARISATSSDSRSPVSSSALRARRPVTRPVTEATKPGRLVVRSTAVARSRQCATSTASGYSVLSFRVARVARCRSRSFTASAGSRPVCTRYRSIRSSAASSIWARRREKWSISSAGMPAISHLAFLALRPSRTSQSTPSVRVSWSASRLS